MEKKLLKLLEDMGIGPGGVSKTLRKEGIKGDIGCYASCPISKYITSKLNMKASVEHEFCGVGELDEKNKWKWYQVENPKGVRKWIEAFDTGVLKEFMRED